MRRIRNFLLTAYLASALSAEETPAQPTGSTPDDASAQVARAAALTKEQLEAITAELLRIRQSDQEGRLKLDEVERKFGSQSAQSRDLWAQIRAADAENIVKVTAILEAYGWLGPQQIGDKANGALFLVIQHSDPLLQRRYLPVMRAAVADGRAKGSSLALLEDRVALGEGRPQTYGSQISRHQATGKYYVRPLLDPDHVDERRAAVGLGPLADYVKKWEIAWDVEAYKRELPELLAQLRPSK